MKLRKHLIGVLLAGVALAGAILLMSAPGFPAASSTPLLTTVDQSAGAYVPDEVLIRFKPGVSATSQTQSISSASSLLLGNPQPGWLHVRLVAGQTVTQALALYGADPNVDKVQPNYLYHATAVPNDPGYGSEWGLRNTAQLIATTPQPGSGGLYAANNPGISGADLDIEPAWDHITDCSAVTVAVVDTGVNYNQTDLATNMWNGGTAYPNHGWDYVNNVNDPMDRNGHGTHVAGTIGAAGNNGTGTTGVCWKSSIMAVRVLDATGSGTTAGVIQGINFAVTHGAKVINMSLSGSYFDAAFSSAITKAQNSGVLVVVAAGNSAANNDGGLTPTYPCNFTQPNLICVAALDQGNQLAAFSNYGISSVDVGAPGVNIMSTWAGTGTATVDPLTSLWNFSTTTTAGWAYQAIGTMSGTLQFLADPVPFQGALYNNATNDSAFKEFGLTGNVAVLEFTAGISLALNDHFRVAYSASGGNPFTGGTTVYDTSSVSTLPYLYPLAMDVSGCISATCSVGFQLQSDAAGQSYGVALTQFSLQTLTFDNVSYNTISGTSMATPHVAGVAAMVMAFNPQYTYADAANAVIKGGRQVGALVGKTTSGRAVDALGALAYINPPTGLQAHVQ